MIDDRIAAIRQLRGGLNPALFQETVLEEHQNALQNEAEKITHILQERKALESLNARELIQKAKKIKIHGADEKQLRILKESLAKIEQSQETQNNILTFSKACLDQLQTQKEDHIQDQEKLGKPPANSNFFNDLMKQVGENLNEFVSKNCNEGTYVYTAAPSPRKQHY